MARLWTLLLLLLVRKEDRTVRKGVRNRGEPAGSPLFLTPYIENNQLDEGRRAAYVDPAPFLNNITSYAGYLTVNKEYNSNLWFWYFPVSDKPVETTPWIIWLQGGPGVSSLFGVFTEIGPFTVKNHTLEEMPYTWNKDHSLLFIDNPVGAGFSFTDDDRGYPTNQTTVGENLYTGLQQFLTLFPELREAPLTIAGESYAGKYIPSFGIQIHNNRDSSDPINLQGLAIGNGLVDPVTIQRYSYFTREIGLVDDTVADTLLPMEANVTKLINDGQMLAAYDVHGRILSTIILEAHAYDPYNYLKPFIDTDISFADFVQTSAVRQALHVGNTTYSSRNHIVFRKLKEDIMRSVKPWLEELLENYKVMVFNGQLDIIVAYHLLINTYSSLSYSGAEDYESCERTAWYHDGKLAGYFKRGGNLLEVMVRGAGHMVPEDQPAAALGLITAFTHGLPLDDTPDSRDQKQHQ